MSNGMCTILLDWCGSVAVPEMKLNPFPNTWVYSYQAVGLHECNKFFVQVKKINVCNGVRRQFDIRH